MTKHSKGWREQIEVHPAADLLPLMSADELKTLSDDIMKKGLTSPIAITTRRIGDDWKYWLIDGRNRLDAVERAGIKFELVLKEGKCKIETELEYIYGGFFPEATVIKEEADIYAYVISANIHRRHLTPEQKRDLIAQILKARPRRSNRAIAKQVGADHKTVAAVRDRLEARGEIPHVSTIEDTKGRKQPTRKSPTNENRPDVGDGDHILDDVVRTAGYLLAKDAVARGQHPDIDDRITLRDGRSSAVQRILEAIEKLDDQQFAELKATLMQQWSGGLCVPVDNPISTI